MRSAKQVQKIEGVVDYIGFIFYENSTRFVNTTPVVANALKVGVFVNASFEEINRRIMGHSLDVIQLHGHETPEFCSQFTPDISVIKAFGIDDQFNFNTTLNYESYVDFFLFDKKTPNHGGSGQQYDWSILSRYEGTTPFFLSGGLQSSSVEALSNFQHPKFAGIDLNSGFEHSPGNKNISELNEFIEQINN